jgi:hypothetical protein
MSCALTQGFTLDCKTAVGGIKSVRFASLSDYQGLAAVVSTGAIQSFASATGVFRKYEVGQRGIFVQR